MVAGGHLGHRRADALDDARPLVAVDRRPRQREEAVAGVHVGLADAARDDADDDFVRRRLGEVELLERPAARALGHDCGGDSHDRRA